MIHDQSDVTSAIDVNVERLLDWSHTFLLDPKIVVILSKSITNSAANTCDVPGAIGFLIRDGQYKRELGLQPNSAV